MIISSSILFKPQNVIIIPCCITKLIRAFFKRKNLRNNVAYSTRGGGVSGVIQISANPLQKLCMGLPLYKSGN